MSARNEHELYADYCQRGIKAAQNRDEAMLLAMLLRQEPAHSDQRHINHSLVKRDIKALYDGFVPNQPEPSVVQVNGRAISGPSDPQLGRPATSTPDELTRRWNSGASLHSFTPAERVQLRQMMISQPAYTDAKHPEHAAYVADAKAMYEMDAPKGGGQ